MIRRVFGSLASVFALLVLSGCMESATVLQVNKDGSGTLVVREFLSQDALSMMVGMETMADAMVAELADADVPGLSGLPRSLQGMVLARAEAFGKGVRLTEVREAANDQGWKGYMARFDFEDVNTVHVASAMAPDDDPSAAESAYRFSFTPGDTAELRLIPHQAEAAPQASGEIHEMGQFDLEGFEPDDDLGVGDLDLGDMMQGMDESMSAMFGEMFRGMRMSLYVDVNGEIVDTDARYRSAARPNRVALVDVHFDELMSHPDALSHMMKNDPESMYKLQDKGVPGLLMEDPGQPLTIRFR